MKTETPSPRMQSTGLRHGIGAWSRDLPAGLATAPALVDAEGVLTHQELDAEVQRAAGHLPDVTTGRRLVHLPVRRDRASVIAHLAVQRAGHVGLLLNSEQPRPELSSAWPADVVATGDPARPFSTPAGELPLHLLHDDLALLLSTSGSTGSPKLVRLSHANLLANAHGIAEALGLTARDRGAMSLPLHYCFGLSVLHSHLAVGGSVALTTAAVTEDRFWTEVGSVTTLPAVPHTLELLLATGRLDQLPPSLRMVTQAGGALDARTAHRVRAVGEGAGWGLAVMYGQTEATARMTVRHPADPAVDGSVGRPLAGSTMRVDRTVPEATDEVGELVFSGPGVMLGYAEEPADLALGDWTPELRTGDLGRVDEHGVVHVTGRRSAVAKVMGLRIDLSRVESLLAEQGLAVGITSDDARLLVAVAGPVPPERVRSLAATASGLPGHLVEVAALPELPRNDRGKVDRRACLHAVLEAVERPQGAQPDADRAAEVDPVEARVRAALTRALGRPARLDASFADQGGDSFSIVRAALALEDLLGPLPRGWHHRPVRDLVRSARGTRPAAGSRPHWWSLRSVETAVVVRAAAVLMILANHLALAPLAGSAHALLVLAGHHLGALTLSAPTARERARRALTGMLALALPASAVALVGVASGRYGWANVVHLNWLLGTVEWGSRIELWFVEALLAAVAVLTALTTLPRVRRLWEWHPWEATMALTLLALVPRYLVIPEATGPTRGLPLTVFWLVAGGVALSRARTPLHRAATLAVLGLGLVDFFATPGRGLVTFALVAVVALVPHVPLPRLVVPATGVVAGASLHIYLVQFPMLHLGLPPVLLLLLALATGIAVARLANPLVRGALRRIAPPSVPDRQENPCSR